MPETRYARLGEDHIAYQTVGSGPRDILFMSAWFSHVDGRWEEPRFAAMLRRLAAMGRLIVFDRRGIGASDPMTAAEPNWEDWADDIRAVMDAADSERATVIGVGDSGPLAMLFAATHPQRVSSLVVINTGARLVQAPDYPWGLSAEDVQRFLIRTKETWGTGGISDVFSPSTAGDERYQQWWARYQRMSASPGRSTAMARLTFAVDARRVLPTIHVPTLVLHRKDFRFFPIELGRYISEHIPGAKFVEVPGADGFIYLGDTDALLSEVEHFVTGARRAVDTDRVLATVLLTDMVGSTDRAAQLGDHRWRAVLDTHDDIVRAQLEAYRGKLHRATGDGLLATFDGPARAVRCAQAMRDLLRETDIHIRSGLHAGEVELRGNEIGGIAVHIAARISAEAGSGQILCSSTVRDLVTGSDLQFVDQGRRQLKGVPQEWQIFEVR
ncbi:MAG TPA: adenylate/guanylate cyclase domain-containing protein [Candidatus Limnocylindria bacterium]|nr:adenylate/guanylate cyclase domain-containing protein [Candidatus Limnocylindria bacterium]